MTERKRSPKSEDTDKSPESKDIEGNIEKLRILCRNNADFFTRDSTENGQRLYISFLAIMDNLELIKPKIDRVKNVMHKFDYDETVPGNGYRSYISVVERAVMYTIGINLKIQQKRDSVLFRKSSLTKDLESCSHLMASLDACLTHLERILLWSTEGNLFPNGEHPPEELFSYAEDVNQYCFYGRCLGFQYSQSLRNILKFITLAMAIFSEAYYSRGSFFSKATNSFLNTTKYITDPDLRARRIVNIAKYASVDFCKAFWFLSESELMNQIPAVVSSSIAVSKIIHIPAEPLSINVNGKDIEVPIPSSHIGIKSVQVRLISHSVHQGMIGEAKASMNIKPASSGLLIHCHGGGFVAQSSRSHESYLRDWAKQLKVPILSIDYSLAPEAPFPRALEEVTYAYCWALKNHRLLGSTGERIVAAGDSAGANLLLSSSLRCISLGIPLPRGIFVAYVPTLVNFVASPARMLCLMDPLLPLGFLLRCLKAYAVPDVDRIQNKDFFFDNNSDTESFEEITESDLQELQAHKSPVSETSDTLTYGSFCSNLNDENDKDTDLNATDVEKSERYVSDFLEKYVLDSDTETEGTKVPPSKQESTSSSQSAELSIHNRVSTFVSSLKNRFSNVIGYYDANEKITKEIPVLNESQEKLQEELNFSIEDNQFLSPILATDDLLKQLPPVKVLTVELDPCLDDCVMIAKRLKALNHDVTLDILKGLPHGFLNFSMVSKEAYEGSKICAKRIKELFNFPRED